MDEQMQAWMKYAEPSTEHAFLAKLQGNWKAKVTMWMQPGGKAEESEGKCSNEMIFGGRFLHSKFHGNMPFGEFHGMSIDGYDRLNEKYTAVWLDSMGTMMMLFEGQAEGNVRTMTCEYTNPMTGKPSTMKAATTVVSEREHRYESWAEGPDGKMFQNMEIIYTRA